MIHRGARAVHRNRASCAGPWHTQALGPAPAAGAEGGRVARHSDPREGLMGRFTKSQPGLKPWRRSLRR